MAEQENQDLICLLNIFPAEIWQLIVNTVPDWTTYQNLRGSSPFFTFFPSKPLHTQQLFPDVAEILFPYLLPKSAFLAAPDNILKTMLNCRLVCRAWNFGITSFLERPIFHVPSVPFDHPYAWQYKYIPKYLEPFINNFFSKSSPKKTIARFNNQILAQRPQHSNPFLSRAVSVTLEKDNVLGYNSKSVQCFAEMTRILEHWGHHLWYANFRIHDPSKKCYQYFQTFLNRMQNLRALRVMVYSNDESEFTWKNQEMASPFHHYKQLVYVKSFDVDNFVWKKFWETNAGVVQVELNTPDQLHWAKFHKKQHKNNNELDQIRRQWEQR